MKFGYVMRNGKPHGVKFDPDVAQANHKTILQQVDIDDHEVKKSISSLESDYPFRAE